MVTVMTRQHNKADRHKTGLPLQIGRLVLASSSPRRQDLMRQAGYQFEVKCPPIPEPSDFPAGLMPRALAESLAYFKARSVAEQCLGATVLGADTIVACDGEVMGKPKDADDARRMLCKLSRNTHEVITGVAVLRPTPGGEGEMERILSSAVTTVTMRPMSEEEIQAYIDSGEWDGKAGAYAIQETADRFVVHIDGSWSNIVGLPMELLAEVL
jgi:septum formation protein